MEGGSANDYSYGSGDPINGRDLDGRCWLVSNHSLPCHGTHPYTLPKGYKLPKPAKGGGWEDAYRQVWKWDSMHYDHWDVTNKGKHTNVSIEGEKLWGKKDYFPKRAIRPAGWMPPGFSTNVLLLPVPYSYLRDGYCMMTNCQAQNDNMA